MRVVVTGSAGFIGSHVVRDLRARGDAVVGVDPRDPHPVSFDEAVRSGDVEGVVHLGAISSTTEDDEQLLERVNVQLPQRIWRWCVREGVPLVYASSAAVYGMGRDGFWEGSACEALNGYARSKLSFDRWALAQDACPPGWAGCRYFNVYGPGEDHKGAMASLVSRTHRDIVEGRPTRLFRWGRQLRDFVWVGDVVRVTIWLLEADLAGVFNVGTGRAETFEHLVATTWRSMGLEPSIEWIDMPAGLRERYQGYTRAETSLLRAAGWTAPFTSLEEGIAEHARAVAVPSA